MHVAAVGCVKRFRADAPGVRIADKFDSPSWLRPQTPVCQRLKGLDTPYSFNMHVAAVGCVKRFRADAPGVRIADKFDSPSWLRPQTPVRQRLKGLDTPYGFNMHVAAVGCVKRFRADAPGVMSTDKFDSLSWSLPQTPVRQRLKRLDTPYSFNMHVAAVGCVKRFRA